MVIPRYWVGYLRVTHPSATLRPSTSTLASAEKLPVRLACVKHAASVHPEPGSNSPFFGRIHLRESPSPAIAKFSLELPVPSS